jgi:hypothetical protein
VSESGFDPVAWGSESVVLESTLLSLFRDSESLFWVSEAVSSVCEPVLSVSGIMSSGNSSISLIIQEAAAPNSSDRMKKTPNWNDFRIFLLRCLSGQKMSFVPLWVIQRHKIKLLRQAHGEMHIVHACTRLRCSIVEKKLKNMEKNLANDPK